MPDVTEGYRICPSCEGVGGYDIGDCEDGVWEECQECLGLGEIPDVDEFVPERDAWRVQD